MHVCLVLVSLYVSKLSRYTTGLQAAGFAVGLHISEQVDTVQTSIAALQAQSNMLLQMMEQMAAKDSLPAALKVCSYSLYILHDSAHLYSHFYCLRLAIAGLLWVVACLLSCIDCEQ